MIKIRFKRIFLVALVSIVLNLGMASAENWVELTRDKGKDVSTITFIDVDTIQFIQNTPQGDYFAYDKRDDALVHFNNSSWIEQSKHEFYFPIVTRNYTLFKITVVGIPPHLSKWRPVEGAEFEKYITTELSLVYSLYLKNRKHS